MRPFHRYLLLIPILLILSCSGTAPQPDQDDWVERTLHQLTLRQKVSQMLVYFIRLDYMTADNLQWQELESLIEGDGIGSIHVWGGEKGVAIEELNEIQRRSRVPVLVEADLEYGLGTRFPGGTVLPWAMALAATGDPAYAREAGAITAREGRALGVHLALAPVVDVNINPGNPIINTRSFGEDPDSVITYALSFMEGLQKNGMAATAKHFPGHGDTDTDSHTRLARIPSDSARLWSIELKPFKALIDNGVDLVMVGHLDAGEFQDEPGIPATLSPFWMQEVLRHQLGFKGLIITDAMAMSAITHNYSDEYALIQTVKAGADIVLQNNDFRRSVDILEKAVRDGFIGMEQIDASVRRILRLKQKLGLDRQAQVPFSRTQNNYGVPENKQMAQEIFARGVTLVRQEAQHFPLPLSRDSQLVILDLYDQEHTDAPSQAADRIMDELTGARYFSLDSSDPPEAYASFLAGLEGTERVLVNAFCSHHMNKNRIFLPEKQNRFLNELHARCPDLMLVSFGTPYLLESLPEIQNYLVVYGRFRASQIAVADALLGYADIEGRLPITIPGIAERGEGIRVAASRKRVAPPSRKKRSKPVLPHGPLDIRSPGDVGYDARPVLQTMRRALDEQAWPGAVLAVGKDGTLFLNEYFGRHTYAGQDSTLRNDIFDLASVSKVIGTTSAAMKLYEDGQLDLDTTVVSYLPEFTHPDSEMAALKATITIRNLLTHTAGLPPYKKFWLMDAPDSLAGLDSVLQSELDTIPGARYRYSDIGLITLGKVIERISGMSLDAFTREKIFRPLEMKDTGYLPDASHPLRRIVPTEVTELAGGVIHGYVHDENSHYLGGVTGHAGLFSTSRDLARFAQMMLNGGSFGDTVIFQPETIELFTHRAGMVPDTAAGASRCLGWDSPSDSSSGGVYLSSNSFGHTGYTGTSIWIDPDNQAFVILLTNAVHPHRSWKYPNYFDWRQAVHSAAYASMGFSEPNPELIWRERWRREQTIADKGWWAHWRYKRWLKKHKR